MANDVVKGTASTRVFKVSLEECMLKNMTELEIPRIFFYLKDAFFKLKGEQTEGIFRVPAVTTEIAALKDSIEKVRKKFSLKNISNKFSVKNFSSNSLLIKNSFLNMVSNPYEFVFKIKKFTFNSL